MGFFFEWDGELYRRRTLITDTNTEVSSSSVVTEKLKQKEET